MIYHKIYITEYKLKKYPEKNHSKLEAIRGIKDLLNQISDRKDIKSITNTLDMENFLVRKKGERLNALERNLVVEIFTYEN